MPPRRPRRPGWYTDPWELSPRRWWDGERWTSRVDDADPAIDGRYGALPVAALAPAFMAIVVGAPLTFLLLVVAQDALPGRPVGEAAAFLALWTAGAVAAIVASRRFGSGDVWRDTGFRVTARDVALGLAVAAALVAVHEVVVRVVAETVVGGLGPRSGFITPPDAQPASLVVVTMVLTGLVGPAAEELLFRGVVQTAMTSRVHPAVAIVAQAVVAGLCHANPGLAGHNVSVVAGWAAAAVVLGVARHLTGRLGAGVVGHGLYHLLVAVAVLRGA